MCQCNKLSNFHSAHLPFGLLWSGGIPIMYSVTCSKVFVLVQRALLYRKMLSMWLLSSLIFVPKDALPSNRCLRLFLIVMGRTFLHLMPFSVSSWLPKCLSVSSRIAEHLDFFHCTESGVYFMTFYFDVVYGVFI